MISFRVLLEPPFSNARVIVGINPGNFRARINRLFAIAESLLDEKVGMTTLVPSRHAFRQ